MACSSKGNEQGSCIWAELTLFEFKGNWELGGSLLVFGFKVVRLAGQEKLSLCLISDLRGRNDSHGRYTLSLASRQSVQTKIHNTSKLNHTLQVKLGAEDMGSGSCPGEIEIEEHGGGASNSKSGRREGQYRVGCRFVGRRWIPHLLQQCSPK
jgi:hypothetical protein